MTDSLVKAPLRGREERGDLAFDRWQTEKGEIASQARNDKNEIDSQARNDKNKIVALRAQ